MTEEFCVRALDCACMLATPVALIRAAVLAVPVMSAKVGVCFCVIGVMRSGVVTAVGAEGPVTPREAKPPGALSCR